MQGTGADVVVAHASDPLAVFGFFLPALLLVAVVVVLIVRDRRLPHGDHEDDETARHPSGATPPRAG